MRKTITLLVQNRPGVLDRVTGLIRRRGWNIDSLTTGDVGEGRSHITLQLEGKDADPTSLDAPLSEMDGVLRWNEDAAAIHQMRELLLFEAPPGHEALAMPGAHVVGHRNGMDRAEITGTPEEVDGYVAALRAQGIQCARSGPLMLTMAWEAEPAAPPSDGLPGAADEGGVWGVEAGAQARWMEPEPADAMPSFGPGRIPAKAAPEGTIGPAAPFVPVAPVAPVAPVVPEAPAMPAAQGAVDAPATPLILAINPGSTSTKAALFAGETEVASTTIRHAPEAFSGNGTILDQKEPRVHMLLGFLQEHSIEPGALSAVVGRGGLVRPIDAGVYAINDAMLRDLQQGSARTHASSLGGIIAAEIGKRFRAPAFVVDPVVVDEMEPIAKLSGIPGIERRSVFHALNARAVARACAQELGMRYEDGRFIVAHMGGGISVGAHRYGRVIDVNDALGGEGPFSPERSGAVPLAPLVEMCYGGQYTQAEMLSLVHGRGGMMAYLGTNDLTRVERMVKSGDDFATLVMDSMAYQVAKEIGAMAATLQGRVNAIILTGGLAYSVRFTGAIRQHVDQIAPVYTRPGEAELLALAQGALRVLSGTEQVRGYP